MIDPRVEKIQRLIDHGATEGEREAAREAMKRLKASGVNTEAQQPPPSSRTPWDDLFGKMPSEFDVAAFMEDLLGRERQHQERQRHAHYQNQQTQHQFLQHEISVARDRVEHTRNQLREAEQYLYRLEAQLADLERGTAERGATQAPPPPRYERTDFNSRHGFRRSSDPRHNGRVWFEKD